MNNPVGALQRTAPPAARDDVARLRETAKQLEGVFVAQLFKAMRETVPEDGLTHGGAGEEMFTGLLDERFSTQAPLQWRHGIGDALVKQLAPQIAHSASTTAAPSTGASPSPKSRTP